MQYATTRWMGAGGEGKARATAPRLSSGGAVGEGDVAMQGVTAGNVRLLHGTVTGGLSKMRLGRVCLRHGERIRRLRLATEGLREMLLATLLLWGGAAGAVAMGVWPVAVPLLIVWIWVLSFFRDPRRVTTCEAFELCAPADGRVTEISRLNGYEAIEGGALRIGVFLSLFNVHVNRSPCAGAVRSIRHEPGLYLDARHPDSGARNESNTLVIDPAAPLPGPIVVRQVAGLVARRIICHAQPGDSLVAGERFGMIKFGSRTELIVPDAGGLTACVRVGDSVSAGVTVLARYNVEQDARGADTAEAKSASETSAL